jgi:hypothetical protein
MSAISRRSIVASAAALPAFAVPAIALENQSALVPPGTDPIFAALERCRSADGAWIPLTKQRDKEWAAAGHPRDHEHPELDAEIDRLVDIEADTRVQLAETVPTTMPDCSPYSNSSSAKARR